jgi:uncharacterized protein (DUF362 family)
MKLNIGAGYVKIPGFLNVDHDPLVNPDFLCNLEELKLPIVEFHGKRYQTVNDNFNHLLLSKEAMEADVIINHLDQIRVEQ